MKKYLCMLFFVSSGQNGENIGCDEKELINVCYLLLDVDNFKIESINDYLIKPINKIDLSDECKKLTSLYDDNNLALNLNDTIKMFDKVIKDLNICGEELLFITDGSIGIRQSLFPECTKKDIILPNYYHSFIDIRKEFQKYSEFQSKINNLDEILNLMMIESNNLSESDSYSVKQCKKMQIIIQVLIQNGNNLQVEYIAKEIENGISSNDENIQLNTVVRVRGLPWHVNVQDVLKFFSGLDICEGGVALCLSMQGRRNGEALVRFINDEHRNFALRRHKHHIGNRYIEVYRASRKEWLNIIEGTNDEVKLFLGRNGRVIVRMRGLPFESNAKDVQKFFESGENSCHIVDDNAGVLFAHYPDGRATGDAFVMFKDEEETNKALLKHKAMMGQRYIELFRSTSAEVQQVIKRCQDQKFHHNKDIHSLSLPLLSSDMITGNIKDCIRCKNLPIECGVEQILEFLGMHSQHIVHQGCHMILNAQGHPSGEAFIQFDNEVSSFNASKYKNGKCMYFKGKKYYIEVTQCSGNEMNMVLLGLLPSNLINTPANFSNSVNFQHMNVGNSYILFNQIYNTTQNISQNHMNAQSFYFPPNSISNQQIANNSSIPTSQFIQANPILQNSPNQFINHQYSSYPPIFYYYTPPVSPSIYLPPQSIYQFQQHNDKTNNSLNLLPTIEFIKILIKGVPSNITTFDIIDTLKDCGEILPEFIQFHNLDGFSNIVDVYITCERSTAEKIFEKNQLNLGNNTIELHPKSKFQNI